MTKLDIILIHAGIGSLVALAALLGQWDSALAGLGGLAALDVSWLAESAK